MLTVAILIQLWSVQSLLTIFFALKPELLVSVSVSHVVSLRHPGWVR